MAIETWLTYVAAVLLLMSTPGPSQLLMLSNSMANGFQRSLATAAGDLTANVLQMLAASLGLGALILLSEHAFTIIKWLGVAYLLWMGIGKIRNAGRGTLRQQQRAPVSTLWLQGFITSAANPRAVLFFAALFPQFISSEGAFWTQFAILGLTYIVLDGLFLSAYGVGATWMAKRATGTAKTWLDRLSGGFLVAAAVLLGLRSMPR